MATVPCHSNPRADPYRTSAYRVVLSRHNFCVATQGLSALTTLCRDSGHGRDTRSKGLCRNKENLFCDPSHPVPAPQTLSQHQGSVATEELWTICRDRDFLSRQAFCLVKPARTRSHMESQLCARTRTCRVAIALAALLSWAVVPAFAAPCRDTENPIAT